MPAAKPSLLLIVVGLGLVTFSGRSGFAHGDGKEALDGSGIDQPHPETFLPTNMEVVAHFPIGMIGGTAPIRDPNGWERVIVNDLWGWTDPVTSHEYALVGRSDALAFVDITAPQSPVFLGLLPTKTQNYWWRDVKTYGDYAFVVADVSNHGMQVFDLTRLRGLTEAPSEPWTADTHYDGFGNSHNIAINPESGLAVAVGTNTFQGGLHFVDVTDPLNPRAAGGVRGIGYAHDAQAVTYHGPDEAYQGKEIVFAYTVNSLSIVDATDTNSVRTVSRTTYPNSQYAHQGWLTEDHRFALMDDELDEYYDGNKTRTHIWNVEDLDSPIYIGFFENETEAIDHNLYIHNGYAFEANYLSGLRVLDLSQIEDGILTEVASLDTHPDSDLPDFGGVWSVYPFFESGNIIMSDMSEGLVIARLALNENSLPGDFNHDDQLTAEDIDLLTQNVLGFTMLDNADLNQDGQITQDDRQVWVKDLAATFFGDTNLDGRFDSSDLTAVFQASQYEDQIPANSTWATGDWNGDLEFTSSDLILALQDGGFELDSAAAITPVPEPGTNLLLSSAWLFLLFVHRKA